MTISEFSIRRPVFTVMITLVVIVIGVVALSRLPVDLMPEITYPTVNVNCSYENTGPEEIEELITRPIEEAMSAVPGVEEVFSTSSEGSSSVRITFEWGTDLDAISDDIRERLDRIVGRLPEDVDRPSLRKFDPAQMPILQIGVLSNLDPIQTRRIIDEQIVYRLERVPGVASVDAMGGREREIQVNLMADKIKALNIPVDTITSKIRQENLDLPIGQIEKGNYEVLLRIPGAFTNLDQIRDTVVAFKNGSPIRLKEIATIEDTFRKITRVVRINDTPGTRIAINKQSGENTVAVAEGIKKELAKIQEDIPQIELILTTDSAKYIQRAINNVGSSAVYGGLLAVLVLLFFLGNVRSTLVIGAAIPISIIGTFALIYFGGFTLNIMTLGGLALGVGMMVDNGIVVLENIYRLHEGGMPIREASLLGSSEVISAIIASTLTTVAVFMPMVFIRGMSGIMFKQLAYVVSFSLIVSLFVALTLVPMLCSRYLKVEHVEHGTMPGFHVKFVRMTRGVIEKLEIVYRRILEYALGHKAVILGTAGGLLVVSLFLIKVVGNEFMPATDEGEVRVSLEMEIGTKLAIMDEKIKTVSAIIREKVPELVSIEESAGGGGWRSGGNSGNVTVKLVPKNERRRSSEQVANDLRRDLAQIPGAIIRPRASGGQQGMAMRGGGGTERLQVEIRGYDLTIAEDLARQVKKVIDTIPGVTDTRISRDMGNPEELFDIDRKTAADMKLSITQIGRTIQTILMGTQATTFRESGREFRVLVKVKDSEYMTTDEILDLTMNNSEGTPVGLRNVVKVRSRKGPVRIERRDRERVITVSGDIANRDMGSVIADAQKALRTVPTPPSFTISFTGDYEEQQKSFRELMLSITLALLLVYMIMAMLYESVRDPFIVMFSVPLAFIGVVLMLWITGTTFNMQSYIGCIMLGGIVVNNAILLVDYTNLLRRRDKMPLREAVIEAGHRRLRPILMTAMTTIIAMVPLAMALGEGAEAQAPLARAVVGGLTSSTLITLVVVPVVYYVFEHKREKKRNAEA